MKMRNKSKGKIHPSPQSPNPLSILNLLPSTILTLISILSLQDKQVLAYMLTRSLTKKTEQTPPHGKEITTPVFNCDCFECYTSYWHQWDTSPDREIIHLAIEAFEERQQKREKRGSRRRERAVRPSLEVDSEKALKESDAVTLAVAVDGVGDVAAPERRVFPEVVGMIGSRLWSFWSPGIINSNNNSD